MVHIFDFFIFRFPVVLRCFHLNPGSGGKGFNRGGDGIIREILFRKKQVLSILSERRAFAPYGLKGKYLKDFVHVFNN